MLRDRKMVLLVLSFAAVYVIWGSTYLAIKYAIETLPTFLMAAGRFLVAGSLLFVISRFSRGYERPTAKHWRTSFIVGTLLLGIGNGFVVLAEHYISSGLAALLVASLPFWMVLLGWGFMGTGRPHGKVVLGLLMGFIGVIILVTGGKTVSGGTDIYALLGMGLIVLASLGWAIGSLYGSRAENVRSPTQAAGMQMLAGGSVLFLVSLITGEVTSFDPAAVSSRSWAALAFLIFFGAVVAYTAYSWLIKNSTPAAISTYAYVNPVIAVLLGWLVAGETMSVQMVVGAAIIVGSVALITARKEPPKRAAGPAADDELTTVAGNATPAAAR